MRWLRCFPLTLEAGFRSPWKQALLWIAIVGGAAAGFKFSHEWQERELIRVRTQIALLEKELETLRESDPTARRVERAGLSQHKPPCEHEHVTTEGSVNRMTAPLLHDTKQCARYHEP
ncbi:hypothetical protein CCYA_CCYA07G2069 [Cyanidiococcus yangmingshanensis]|nr:hypothetical protein CCYA_CCYA07G2069 [Cyanidiococcus yangmingshanensis]